MDNEFLNIVDEQGNVIGKETRYKIHREGLLHKIVHVWFYTPDKELIFQRRGRLAETHPNELDATAGGHVEIGQSDIQAALEEVKEETGTLLRAEGLVPIAVEKFGPGRDEATGTFNAHLVMVFGHLFRGKLEDLKAESDEDGGISFEIFPVDKILALTEAEAEKKGFIPALLKPKYLEIYKKIKKL
ncbi:MAG: NUDIX domain-containing protein [Candidatus Brennerbacteria bacterium]|nr:NUDIX domain-containing protein [Candidatus Brennerbacteria bacterium]